MNIPLRQSMDGSVRPYLSPFKPLKALTCVRSLHRQCNRSVPHISFAVLTATKIWNVLDSSFIVIVLLYLGFRIRGLVEGDREHALHLNIAHNILTIHSLADISGYSMSGSKIR